jgi:hypothetical protein
MARCGLGLPVQPNLCAYITLISSLAVIMIDFRMIGNIKVVASDQWPVTSWLRPQSRCPGNGCQKESQSFSRPTN